MGVLPSFAGQTPNRAKFFIDNEKNVQYISNRIKSAVDKCIFDCNNLIIIGHFCPETAEALMQNLEYIRNHNIELVFADEILE